MAVISNCSDVALFTFDFAKILLGTVTNICDEVAVMIFSTSFSKLIFWVWIC